MQTDLALLSSQSAVAVMALVCFFFPPLDSNRKQPHWVVVYSLTTVAIFQASRLTFSFLFFW